MWVLLKTRGLLALVGASLALAFVAAACGGEAANPADETDASVSRDDGLDVSADSGGDADSGRGEAGGSGESVGVGGDTDDSQSTSLDDTDLGALYSTGEQGLSAIRVNQSGHDVQVLVALEDGRLAASTFPSGVLVVWDPDDLAATPISVDQSSSSMFGDSISAVGLMADGRLAISNGEYINAWDPASGATERGVNRAQTGSSAIVGLPDGRVASSGGGFGESYGVQLWDPNDPLGTPLVYRTDAEISDMALLPDGRLATVMRRGGLEVWSPTDGQTPPVAVDVSGVAVAALADGRVVVGSPQGEPITVWDPADTSLPVQEFDGHSSTVRSVVALSDGRVASGGNDGTIQVWDPDRPAEPPLVAFGAGSTWSLVELADGRLAAGGGAGVVYLWDLSAADAAAGRIPLPQPQGDLALSDLAVGSTLPAETAPDVEPLVTRFEGHGQNVAYVLALPDGRVVSIDSEVALVWDPEDVGVAPARFNADRDVIREPAVLPGGLIVWARAGGVQVWDPSNPDAEVRMFSFRGLSDLTAIEVLSTGKVVARTSRFARVLDLEQPDAEPVSLDGAPGSGAPATAASPDGQRVYYSNPTDADLISVDITDPAAEPTIITLDDFGSYVPAIEALPDGRIAIAGQDAADRFEVRVIDPNNPSAEPVRYREHLSNIGALAVLPDGRVASGDGQGQVHIWDPDDLSAVRYGPATDCERPIDGLTVVGGGTSIAVAQVRDIWLWGLDSTVADRSPCA